MDEATDQDGHEQSRRLANSRLPALVKEALNVVFNRISHEELPTVRSDIRRTAERIFGNWGTLRSIVERHEATIQKRWTKKSIMKRRELLLTTWPNMAQDHRPDVALEMRSYSQEFREDMEGMLQGKPRQQKMYDGRQREALLMPYINLHDLTKTEPLLLMVNARARQPPNAFSSRDLQLSTSRPGLTESRWLEGYIMDFDGHQSGPEEYGKLREGQWNADIDPTGGDYRLSCGCIAPGDGLWILEIQDRIYKFLLDAVQRILRDIPTGDLTGPKYAIQPEPSLPSANSQEDGVVSLASTNLEAIYSSPGQMDLHRLQCLVAAKANEEEDKLWALREDPGRFSEGLEDVIAHRPEYVPDSSGTLHPTTTVDGCESWYGSDLRNIQDVFSIFFMGSQFVRVEFWNNLLQEITDLVELKKKHFDNGSIKPNEPLPEPFAVAFYKVQFMLWSAVERQASILQMAAFSSPPVRPYTRRSSAETLDNFEPNRLDKKPPRHIFEFMKILIHIFHETSIKMAGYVAGLQSLMEQYDKFINNVPNAHQSVSSYVAKEISNLALMSECLRQVHLFQPWASKFREEIQTPRLQAVIYRCCESQERAMTPLETFRPSAQVLSMASAIAKSAYPGHKKRTAANVNAMQSAEELLDRMWDAMLTEMEQRNALLVHSKKVLLLQGRQLQRTSDWVKPAEQIKKTPLQVPVPELQGLPFGGLNIDDKNKVPEPLKDKTKIKTRGTATLQPSASTPVETTEPEDPSPAHTIQVDRRAFKVFSMLFHKPTTTSKPGEVPWIDFLHAMRSAGFGMENLYGSVWQFTLRDDTDGRVGAGVRSILFHEPHPHSKIPFWDARRHGRRLGRTYGWSGETFVVK